MNRNFIIYSWAPFYLSGVYTPEVQVGALWMNHQLYCLVASTVVSTRDVSSDCGINKLSNKPSFIFKNNNNHKISPSERQHFQHKILQSVESNESTLMMSPKLPWQVTLVFSWSLPSPHADFLITQPWWHHRLIEILEKRAVETRFVRWESKPTII